MQKNVHKREALLFTSTFIAQFTHAVNRVYNYSYYMDFMIVPSVLGSKTLSYLPLLNYTDKKHDAIEDLCALAQDNHFHIRVLNFTYETFKKNDTVTMRLNIADKNSDVLFMEHVKPRCRNKIRNALKKHNYILKHGKDEIENFYAIFSQTMHKHGTPVLDKKIFYALADEFQDKIIFFTLYHQEEVAASMCIILDENIAWYPWGGVDEQYSKKLAGYFMYWKVLEYICDNYTLDIFDFGRSSYGGATFNFKSQFGALPVKIDILSSNSDDVYSKYSLASSLWKKLPKFVVDYMGPKLCKYLVDL